MNRLDARARLVFHYAREEADRLGHAVIESEHLLLGLLREGGTAAQVLNGAGLTLEAARHRVVELIGRFERSRDAPPPAITALARRVMDLAGVEAARYQSSFINTGFVLLGMIHAGDGVAMGIINQTSDGTKGVRRATLAALQLPADPEEADTAAQTSSLSGIVAVPADSVLAKLLNPKQEVQAKNVVLETQKVAEPVHLEAIELAPQTELAEPVHLEVTELPLHTEVAELPHTEVAELPHTEVAEVLPLAEATEPPPIEVILEIPHEDDIPESMLIDVAFEEVPLEEIETAVIASQVALTEEITPDEPPLQKITLEEIMATPEANTTFEEIQAEQQLETAIEEIETPASDPIEPALKTTDEIMSEVDPATKVTAEVLVAEIQIMPESILASIDHDQADSIDGLLVSDLPELLEPYQAPILEHFSSPQTDLEILEPTADLVELEPLQLEPLQLEPVQLENATDSSQTEIESTTPELEPEVNQNRVPNNLDDSTIEFDDSILEPIELPRAPEVSTDLTFAPDSPMLEPETTLKTASWDMVTASSMIKRQIIALGGGGFSQEPSNLLLEQYILEVASSAREVAVPRVCFVSTAAGDSRIYIERFYAAFKNLNCQANHLALYHTEDWADELEDMILGADVLYFSGGSTKNALALWQAWELEPIFKRAYEAGTVFTGVSAGAICWFEQFTSDSVGRSLGVMNGLGWLPGSFTPHYDSERFRKLALEKFLRAQKIAPGFAADDNAAIHFVNDEYVGAVAAVASAKAYHVTLGRNRLVESALETRLLG